MITEKPKLGVVQYLREYGFRVTERPADDGGTFFRRLTGTITIRRDAVEKCFHGAKKKYQIPAPEAIDEAMGKLQILADLANISRKPSSRDDVVKTGKPYLLALKKRRDEWNYWRAVRPLRDSEAVDANEIDAALRLAENIVARYIETRAMNDWEECVIEVARIGRKAWESVGMAPLDATHPETSTLTKFTFAAMALLGAQRRPRKDEKRAKPNARPAIINPSISIFVFRRRI